MLLEMTFSRYAALPAVQLLEATVEKPGGAHTAVFECESGTREGETRE